MAKKRAGRPRKYKSEKELLKATESYFNSIGRTKEMRDEKGEVVFNDLGEAVLLREYFVPPSVTGLCLYLGIDRSTWNNYEEIYPEATKSAMIVFESYLEEELIKRKNGVTGIIFNLQNNYGWKEKRDNAQSDCLDVVIKVVE